jgi:O-antigen ligase
MSAVSASLAAHDRLAWLVVATAGLVPLVAFFAPLGLAAGLVLAAIVALLVGPRRDLLAAIPRGPACVAGLFLVWAFISTTWAVQPQVALHKAFQLLGLFAAGFIVLGAFRGGLSDRARKSAGLVLAAGIGLVLGLFIIEIVFDAPLSFLLYRGNRFDLHWLMTRHNRATTVVAILLVPAALSVHHRFGARAVVAFVALAIVILSFMSGRTAMVSAVLAASVAAAALLWPVVVRWLVAAGLAATIFLAPLLPTLIPSTPERLAVVKEEAARLQVFSLFHRLRIWEFTVERIGERPILGWGLDSSRALPGGKDESDAAGERMSLHPHNNALQVRVELGLPGLLLASVLALWPIVRLRRYCADGATGILGAASAVAIVASMSYGVWQSWWVAALWFTAALASLGCAGRNSTT